MFLKNLVEFCRLDKDNTMSHQKLNDICMELEIAKLKPRNPSWFKPKAA